MFFARLYPLSCMVTLIWMGNGAVVFSSPPKESDAVINADLGKKLDAAVQSVGKGTFWGAVLVAKDGKIILAKGYGMADRKNRPMTTHSLFDIGSTAKQFTATAILKLEMQGKLSTEDPIGKFIKNVPEDKEKITIRHLLTHTSGLPREIALDEMGYKSREVFIKTLMKAKLESPPGESFSYNNVGYFLLAAIIEKASGNSFETYLKKNIFLPAGLRETGFVTDKSLDRRNETTRASGGMVGNVIDYPWNWANRGATGIVTTVLDMQVWDQALRGDSILTAEEKKKLYAPGPSGYGFGWFVQNTPRNTTCVEHGGKTRGYSSEFCRYLEEDIVIVVLSNEEGNVTSIRTAIEGVLFPPFESGLEATLYLEPYILNKDGLTEIRRRAKWRVMRQYSDQAEKPERVVDRRAALMIEDPQEPCRAAVIKMEIPVVRKLTSDLEGALNHKGRNAEQQASPTMDVVLATKPYKMGEGHSIKLPTDVTWTVLPQYVGVDDSGQRHVDGRLTLVLEDRKNQFWPIIVKMNAPAAMALLNDLKTTVP